jgi:anti-sigma factor RsiW
VDTGQLAKVNRCLTEGRQALSVRLAGIQGGIECAKLAPLLSALADGEANAEQLSRLRPHMKTCLACRATLRAFREAPEQVAALSPPATLLVSDPDGGSLRSLLESIAGAAQQKAAVVGERAGAVSELATGQKIAAVAASAAALAGGGTAVDQFAGHQGPPQPPPAEQVEANPVKEEAPVEPPPAAPDPLAVPGPPAAPEPAPVEPAPAQPVAPEPPPPPPPPPDPANEFAPGGTSAATTSASAAPATPAQPAPAAPTPAPAPARPAAPAGGGGSSEFAP